MRSKFIVFGNAIQFHVANSFRCRNIDERSISDRTICLKRNHRLIAYHQVVMWTVPETNYTLHTVMKKKERKIWIGWDWMKSLPKIFESTIHPNMCHSVWRMFACSALRACDAVLLRYVLRRSVLRLRVGELDDLQIATLQNNIKYFVIHDVIGGSFGLGSATV